MKRELSFWYSASLNNDMPVVVILDLHYYSCLLWEQITFNQLMILLQHAGRTQSHYEPDIWGTDMKHDWPTWRAMLPYYIESRF